VLSGRQTKKFACTKSTATEVRLRMRFSRRSKTLRPYQYRPHGISTTMRASKGVTNAPGPTHGSSTVARSLGACRARIAATAAGVSKLVLSDAKIDLKNVPRSYARAPLRLPAGMIVKHANVRVHAGKERGPDAVWLRTYRRDENRSSGARDA